MCASTPTRLLQATTQTKNECRRGQRGSGELSQAARAPSASLKPRACALMSLNSVSISLTTLKNNSTSLRSQGWGGRAATPRAAAQQVDQLSRQQVKRMGFATARFASLCCRPPMHVRAGEVWLQSTLAADNDAASQPRINIQHLIWWGGRQRGRGGGQRTASGLGW